MFGHTFTRQEKKHGRPLVHEFADFDVFHELLDGMSYLVYLLTSKHSRVLLWLSVPDACGVYFPQDYQAAYISSRHVISTCEQMIGVNRMGFRVYSTWGTDVRRSRRIRHVGPTK